MGYLSSENSSNNGIATNVGICISGYAKKKRGCPAMHNKHRSDEQILHCGDSAVRGTNSSAHQPQQSKGDGLKRRLRGVASVTEDARV